MAKRRVVVTGLGAVCPVGNSAKQSWSNIVAGKSGIARITRFDPTPFAAQIAGEVKGFDVGTVLSAKEARRVDVFIHYGMAAAVEALGDAGISPKPENAERYGVNIGSGIGGLPMIEDTHRILMESGPRKISPFFIPGAIINMVS
ncbi:MAG: beta-ketoacyl synthase N-terminal-like domain-containing protein, partial [Betaproteobacteria bacterium]